MSNIEDTSPSRYMEARAIVARCQDSLERLDADDPLRFNVEALMELAEAEAAKAAAELPY
jgi:hypothetical protein